MALAPDVASDEFPGWVGKIGRVGGWPRWFFLGGLGFLVGWVAGWGRVLCAPKKRHENKTWPIQRIQNELLEFSEELGD